MCLDIRECNSAAKVAGHKEEAVAEPEEAADPEQEEAVEAEEAEEQEPPELLH
jgi:hypothetical protein